MGLSLLGEIRRVEPIATVMRRLEWFQHVKTYNKRRAETDNIAAVADMKMPRERPRLEGT